MVTIEPLLALSAAVIGHAQRCKGRIKAVVSKIRKLLLRTREVRQKVKSGRAQRSWCHDLRRSWHFLLHFWVRNSWWLLGGTGFQIFTLKSLILTLSCCKLFLELPDLLLKNFHICALLHAASYRALAILLSSKVEQKILEKINQAWAILTFLPSCRCQGPLRSCRRHCGPQ